MGSLRFNKQKTIISQQRSSEGNHRSGRGSTGKIKINSRGGMRRISEKRPVSTRFDGCLENDDLENEDLRPRKRWPRKRRPRKRWPRKRWARKRWPSKRRHRKRWPRKRWPRKRQPRKPILINNSQTKKNWKKNKQKKTTRAEDLYKGKGRYLKRSLVRGEPRKPAGPVPVRSFIFIANLSVILSNAPNTHANRS